MFERVNTRVLGVVENMSGLACPHCEEIIDVFGSGGGEALAREMELPTLEYPQLARSVYYTTRERQVICEDLYGAIASVLAYVMSLKRGETPMRPDIDVPEALRFDTEGRISNAGAVNRGAAAPL